MILFICDRCGKPVSTEPVENKEDVLILRKLNDKPMDLCDECQQSLKGWYKQGNTPMVEEAEKIGREDIVQALDCCMSSPLLCDNCPLNTMEWGDECCDQYLKKYTKALLTVQKQC